MSWLFELGKSSGRLVFPDVDFFHGTHTDHYDADLTELPRGPMSRSDMFTGWWTDNIRQALEYASDPASGRLSPDSGVILRARLPIVKPLDFSGGVEHKKITRRLMDEMGIDDPSDFSEAAAVMESYELEEALTRGLRAKYDSYMPYGEFDRVVVPFYSRIRPDLRQVISSDKELEQFLKSSVKTDFQRAVRTLRALRNIEPDKVVSPWSVHPPNPVRNPQVFDRLASGFARHGWTIPPLRGYPLEGKDGHYRVMNGSHRVLAAREADVDVPLVLTAGRHGLFGRRGSGILHALKEWDSNSAFLGDYITTPWMGRDTPYVMDPDNKGGWLGEAIRMPEYYLQQSGVLPPNEDVTKTTGRNDGLLAELAALSGNALRERHRDYGDQARLWESFYREGLTNAPYYERLAGHAANLKREAKMYRLSRAKAGLPYFMERAAQLIPNTPEDVADKQMVHNVNYLSNQTKAAARAARNPLDLMESVMWRASPGYQGWSKSKQKEWEKTGNWDGANRVAVDAQIESVSRILRNSGWKSLHTSPAYRTDWTGKIKPIKRAGSRYFLSPDGSREIRVADHNLPGGDAHAYEQYGVTGKGWEHYILETDDAKADPRRIADYIISGEGQGESWRESHKGVGKSSSKFDFSLRESPFMIVGARLGGMGNHFPFSEFV